MLKKRAILVAFVVSVVIALIATGAGDGPINVGLGIRTSDIVSYLVVIDRPEMFADSIHMKMADTVTSIIPFNRILSIFFSDDRSPQYVHISIYFLTIFFRIFILILIGSAISGTVGGGFVLLGVVAFSIETTLIPYRVISSTIAGTFALVAIVAALKSRFFIASAVAGILVCLHPTIGFFLEATILVGFIAVASLVDRLSILNIIKAVSRIVAVWGLFASPFLALSLLEIKGQVGILPINDDVWWRFVPSLNNLAFPVVRGIPNMAGYVASYLLAAGLIIGTVNIDRRWAIFLTACFFVCASAHLTQALFTSVIQSQLVAQLALNHRANAIGQPLICIAFTLVIVSRVERGDLHWFTYLSLIMVWLFHDGLGISKVTVPSSRFDTLVNASFVQADTILALSLAILLAGKLGSNWRALSGVAAVVCFAWIFNYPPFYLFLIPILFGYLMQTSNPYGLKALIREDWRVWATTKHQLSKSYLGSVYEKALRATKSWIQNEPKEALFTLLATVFLSILASQLPLRDSFRSWALLATGEIHEPWIKNFLEQYVPESDHVIVMPLRGEGGVWLTPTPWRRAYLDNVEGHYLLYQPSLLPYYLERLRAYAVDKRSQDWYLDANNWRGANGIRAGVPSIQNLDEKARWILTYDRFVCGNDIVHAVYNGYGSGPPGELGKVVLIKAENFDSTCVYGSAVKIKQ